MFQLADTQRLKHWKQQRLVSARHYVGHVMLARQLEALQLPARLAQ